MPQLLTTAFGVGLIVTIRTAKTCDARSRRNRSVLKPHRTNRRVSPVPDPIDSPLLPLSKLASDIPCDDHTSSRDVHVHLPVDFQEKNTRILQAPIHIWDRKMRAGDQLIALQFSANIEHHLVAVAVQGQHSLQP